MYQCIYSKMCLFQHAILIAENIFENCSIFFFLVVDAVFSEPFQKPIILGVKNFSSY